MRRETIPIKTLLLRIFVPAVVLVSMLLAVFVYNWLYSTIIDGFDRKLTTTSTLVGAMIDPADHDQLILTALASDRPEDSEQSAAYLRNVMPIRRIRTKLELTYLYSQALGGSQDVTYVLDGSEGDEHSPIGSEDVLSETTMSGLQIAEAGGPVFVSPIEYQEQWGLLKTAAAPVYGADGQITATAGADVDISVIQVATQNALFASALIGIGSILMCLLVAVAIVRRVALPIEALKDDALKFAGGDGHSARNLAAPREVAGLREGLSALAAKMAAAAGVRKAEAAHHEHAADAALLVEAGLREGVVALTEQHGARIFWIANADTGLHGAVAAGAMRGLAQKFTANPALADHWKSLADTQDGACLIVRDDRQQIELLGNAQAAILRGDEVHVLVAGTPVQFDAAADTVRLGADRELQLGKGGTP